MRNQVVSPTARTGRPLSGSRTTLPSSSTWKALAERLRKPALRLTPELPHRVEEEAVEGEPAHEIRAVAEHELEGADLVVELAVHVGDVGRDLELEAPVRLLGTDLLLDRVAVLLPPGLRVGQARPQRDDEQQRAAGRRARTASPAAPATAAPPAGHAEQHAGDEREDQREPAAEPGLGGAAAAAGLAAAILVVLPEVLHLARRGLAGIDRGHVARLVDDQQHDAVGHAVLEALGVHAAGGAVGLAAQVGRVERGEAAGQPGHAFAGRLLAGTGAGIAAAAARVGPVARVRHAGVAAADQARRAAAGRARAHGVGVGGARLLRGPVALVEAAEAGRVARVVDARAQDLVVADVVLARGGRVEVDRHAALGAARDDVAGLGRRIGVDLDGEGLLIVLCLVEAVLARIDDRVDGAVMLVAALALRAAAGRPGQVAHRDRQRRHLEQLVDLGDVALLEAQLALLLERLGGAAGADPDIDLLVPARHVGLCRLEPELDLERRRRRRTSSWPGSCTRGCVTSLVTFSKPSSPSGSCSRISMAELPRSTWAAAGRAIRTTSAPARTDGTRERRSGRGSSSIGLSGAVQGGCRNSAAQARKSTITRPWWRQPG